MARPGERNQLKAQIQEKEKLMRSPIITLVLIVVVGIFVADVAFAAGPQFTGLMNIYDTTTTQGFSERSNSLATMDKDGPIAGTVIPLARNWSDIVVSPDHSRLYAITGQEVYRINPITGAETKLVINSPVPPGEDHSWTVGETWDTARNRLVVATLGGTGFFFGYLDATDQWTTIGDLHQFDLRSITYRPSNDLIYGQPNVTDGPTTEIRKYNPATGQQVGTLLLPVPLPQAEYYSDLDWQMMLASDEQLAVVVPRYVPRPGGGTMAGNWLYLINPDTGVISYSAPLPVPEPGMIGVASLAVMIALRRSRR